MDPSISTYTGASFAKPGQAAAAVPFGARGATALGSGLRSGTTLVDGADRAFAELQELREAAAEAAREAARAEQRAATAERDQVRAETAVRGEDADSADRPRATLNGAEFSDEEAERSINAAREAAAQGEPVPRGAFFDLAV